MNIEQAIQNIDILIQNTRMTRQEHVELQSNLQLLAKRAQLADELEKKLEEMQTARAEKDEVKK